MLPLFICQIHPKKKGKMKGGNRQRENNRKIQFNPLNHDGQGGDNYLSMYIICMYCAYIVVKSFYSSTHDSVIMDVYPVNP